MRAVYSQYKCIITIKHTKFMYNTKIRASAFVNLYIAKYTDSSFALDQLALQFLSTLLLVYARKEGSKLASLLNYAISF